MSEIRINKVQVNIPPQTKTKITKEAPEEKNVKSKQEYEQKPAEDVLDYMAKSAMPLGIKSKKNIDVDKYIDAKSKERIEKIMQTFEETILKSAETAIQEFGLSEKAANDAAIVGFGRKFLQ